jgi:uncharacterized protein
MKRIQFNTKRGIIELDYENNLFYSQDVPLTKHNDLVVESYDYKIRNPKKIKIVLGHGCNYRCVYCLQDDLSSKSHFKEFSVVDDIKRNLDFTQLERIELWGGEPLLYWDKIKKIIEAFDRPKLVWSMVTNGTLLTPEIVNYLNGLQGDVAIAISHDAKKQQELRGSEFLHTKEKVFEKLNNNKKINYTFTVTLSNNNYDLFEINDFFKQFITFYDLAPIKLNFSLVEGYDEKSAAYVIQGDNLPKFSKIVNRFVEENIDDLLSKRTDRFLINSIVHSLDDIKSVMGYLNFIKNPAVIKSNVKCDLDKNTDFSFDINGKVRACQNVGEDLILGSLDEIEKVRLKPEWLIKKDKCKDCHVNALCGGGCPYIKNTEFFDLNCQQHYTFYKIIQQKAIELLGGWK